MDINEHILKINHSVNLPKGLELDKRYLIRAEIDCKESKDTSNEDGTINRQYKCKFNGVVELLDDGRQIIEAKTKKTRSQAMHSAMWYVWRDLAPNIPFDEFYDVTMAKMNNNLSTIVNFINSL